MELSLLDPALSSWSAEVDQLRNLLGAPQNSALFPPQFLKAAFPRIGGRIAVCREGAEVVGAGFLFPRGLQDGRREFTLRFQPADSAFRGDAEVISAQIERLLGGDRVAWYDPQEGQCYERTSRQVGVVDIGRPDAAEAIQVRALQHRIWRGEADLLYPADIHSRGFRAGTSLVARDGGSVVGFLFGFLKFAGAPLPEVWSGRVRSDFRVESQLLGVSPECRARGIGFILKKAQAEQARQEGIDVVNWTVDPLQFANAVLNFCKLRAVAMHFYPDYYPVRNELNQVPASRVAITWLVAAEQVQQALSGLAEGQVRNLAANRTIPRVNAGWAEFHLDEGAPAIAIEIPADWTALQKEDRPQALRWRETTDALFQHYLGIDKDRYAITGIGEDGARKYLLAERVDQALLEHFLA